MHPSSLQLRQQQRWSPVSLLTFKCALPTKQILLLFFLHFSSKYDRPEVTTAIHDLLVWRRSEGPDFAAKWFNAFDAGDKSASDLNQARRTINRYFDEIVRTYEGGLIQEKLVRSLAARFGLLVYYDIIVPMNHEMFGKKYLDRSKTLRKLSAHYNGSTSLDVELSAPKD